MYVAPPPADAYFNGTLGWLGIPDKPAPATAYRADLRPGPRILFDPRPLRQALSARVSNADDVVVFIDWISTDTSGPGPYAVHNAGGYLVPRSEGRAWADWHWAARMHQYKGDSTLYGRGYPAVTLVIPDEHLSAITWGQPYDPIKDPANAKLRIDKDDLRRQGYSWLRILLILLVLRLMCRSAT